MVILVTLIHPLVTGAIGCVTNVNVLILCCKTSVTVSDVKAQSTGKTCRFLFLSSFQQRKHILKKKEIKSPRT